MDKNIKLSIKELEENLEFLIEQKYQILDTEILTEIQNEIEKTRGLIMVNKTGI